MFFTFIAGLLLILGICNDMASMTEIVTYSAIGIALITISVLFTKHTCYLDFITPNGRIKTIHVNSLAAKLLTIRKYQRNGYKLHSEWEIAK